MTHTAAPATGPDPIVAALTERRRAAGISRRQLAQRIGVAHSTVRGWEVGIHRMTVADARTVAAVLGCNLVLTPRA